MGAVLAVDEPDPRPVRHVAGRTAGDPALSLLDLFDGAAASRILRRAAGHGVGIGHGDLRADPAPGHGGGGSGLDRGVYDLADRCRVLSGLDPAGLAAARLMGVAVDLRVRRNAGGPVLRDLPN